MEGRPLLSALGRRPIVSGLLGQRERGPIVGVLLRMKPEARGEFIADLMADTLTWAIGLGIGRILMRVIDMNLAEFLGTAPKHGVRI